MYKKMSTVYDQVLPGTSLFIFGPHSSIRLLVSNIVLHPYFDNFILIVIVASTITMAIDNPLNDPNSVLAYNMGICDIVFTSIFTLEALLKIIYFGFLFNGKNSYLRLSWNIMDFFIVAFSVSIYFLIV